MPSRAFAYEVESSVALEFEDCKIRKANEWYEMDFRQRTALEKYIDKYLERAA